MSKKLVTRIVLVSVLFSLNFLGHAQDIIRKISGEIIVTEIQTIGIDDIEYKQFDNLDGPNLKILKKEVAKILFENGTTEEFSKKTSNIEEALEETKDLLVKEINAHGFEANSFKSKYKASFEGNYLRLIELKKKSTEPKNEGILFDFSNVYKFEKLSKRSEELVYLNIWVSILKNEKKNKFDKHKLVMRVDGVDNAVTILTGLKQLNKLLLEQ